MTRKPSPLADPNIRHKGFADPAVLKKAMDASFITREKAKRKKEALEDGFSKSKASDPDVQAGLINRLVDMAMGDDKNAKWAFDELIKAGVMKQPAEAVEVKEKEEMSATEALELLKKRGF